MLNVLGETITIKGDNGNEAPLAFAYAWKQSDENKKIQNQISEIAEIKDEKLEIVVEKEYAASRSRRDMLMANRLVTIYWRSPSYNLGRMMLSLFIGTLLISFQILCTFVDSHIHIRHAL